MVEKDSVLADIRAQRLLYALELMEVGIQIMRQNIARKLPASSQQHIDTELRRWLMEQPKTFIPKPENQDA